MNEGADEEAPTCNSGGLSCEDTDKQVGSVSFFKILLWRISHNIFLAVSHRLRNG